MPAQTDEQAPDIAASLDEAEEAPSPGGMNVSRSASDVRGTPEYIAAQKELRKAAREAGSAKAELAQLRASIEADRLAAEAERQALQDAKIREVLGEEGVAEWQDLAELSASDPVAAAVKLRDLMLQKQEQSATDDETTAEATATEDEEEPVNQKVQAPPAPPRGVAADAPLQARPATAGYDEIIERSQKRFDEVVERNQNPVTRNRVTMRDRAAGIMAYLEGAYTKTFRDRESGL